MTLDIGWFSTGRGPGSRRLLAAVQDEIASGRLDARIAVVFCNRNPGEDENTDLFLEEIGPDGRSVRLGEGFVPCEARVERIKVRGGPPVIEEVLITPHGPLIGPALAEAPGAFAFRALWLDPLPLEGYLRIHTVRSFAELREVFARWPVLSLK